MFAIDIDESAGLSISTTEDRREVFGYREMPDKTCRLCGGRLRVFASIEESAAIERILEYLRHAAKPVDPAHPSRATPQGIRLV